MDEKAISELFGAAAKVGNEWSLAAFAIAAVAIIAVLVLRKRSMSRSLTQVVGALAAAMVILGSLPLLSRTYLATHGIYRVRVAVIDPNNAPVNDAKITCSIGGEAKSVDGGVEFDIPVVSRPRSGRITMSGRLPSAFLSGTVDVDLADDLYVAVQLRLEHDRSARIRGQVVDRKGIPVLGAQVSIVGYGSEAVTTGTLGQFDLPAHAADGEQVQIAAFKKGMAATSEWEQAGQQPATIVLSRN
jgi:hypothetical protein